MKKDSVDREERKESNEDEICVKMTGRFYSLLHSQLSIKEQKATDLKAYYKMNGNLHSAIGYGQYEGLYVCGDEGSMINIVDSLDKSICIEKEKICKLESLKGRIRDKLM